MSKKLTPKSTKEWGSAVLVWFGMVGLVACFVVWVVTPDHILAPSFVGAFTALLGGGLGGRILLELKEPLDPPADPQPPIPPGNPISETKQEAP